MVNDRSAGLHTDLGSGVDPTMPHGSAEAVEIFGVTALEQGFGLAVAGLLFEVGGDGIASVVPDETGRAESDLVASLLEPPANIHIIAGLTVNGVKAADLPQCPSVECHVAAGDVLGDAVVEHHMGGASWRNHHCRGRGGVVRGE